MIYFLISCEIHASLSLKPKPNIGDNFQQFSKPNNSNDLGKFIYEVCTSIRCYPGGFIKLVQMSDMSTFLTKIQE